MYTPAKGKQGRDVDWGQGVRQAWGDMSEQGALTALQRFVESAMREVGGSSH